MNTISPQADDGKALHVAVDMEMHKRMGEKSEEQAYLMLYRQIVAVMEANKDKALLFHPIEKRVYSFEMFPQVMYLMRWGIVERKEIVYAPLPKFPKGANFWERLVFLFTGKVQEEYKYE